MDRARAKEARALRQAGCRALVHTKYCFRKRPENLMLKQQTKLAEVIKRPLKTVRAWLLKEDFEALWVYATPRWARWFLHQWCRRAARSRLPEFVRVAHTLKQHRELIFNWFRVRKQFSNSITESLNRRVNLITRRAYGYRVFSTFRVSLPPDLGNLPEPPVSHGFS